MITMIREECLLSYLRVSSIRLKGTSVSFTHRIDPEL